MKHWSDISLYSYKNTSGTGKPINIINTPNFILENELQRLKNLGYKIYEENNKHYAYNEEGGFEVCCE